jgi:hypothetical protein
MKRVWLLDAFSDKIKAGDTIHLCAESEGMFTPVHPDMIGKAPPILSIVFRPMRNAPRRSRRGILAQWPQIVGAWIKHKGKK